MFLNLWYLWIIWYKLAGFKTIIILYFAHPIYDLWNVFSPKVWFLKTSTRIMKCESRVVKSNPVLLSMMMILLSVLSVIRHLISGISLNWLNSNWLLNLYVYISIVMFYTVCFYCMPSWRLSKFIENKPQTARLYLIQSFF